MFPATSTNPAVISWGRLRRLSQMSAELPFIFTFFLCFLCNLSNDILSLLHTVSVKWDPFDSLLLDYKQIVTVGQISVISALVAEHFTKENNRSENEY